VRLIFNGRVLDQDSKTLSEAGVFEQCVVHCLIINKQSRPPGAGANNVLRSGGTERGEVNIASIQQQTPEPFNNARALFPGGEPGLFFVGMVGVIIVLMWFICFHFGQQLFAQSAVVSLIILTAIFVIGVVAFYLPVNSNRTPTPNNPNNVQ